MRNTTEILTLLDQLNEVVADELEDQDLDFKEWKGSLDHMVKLVVEMAVCMANGGGGTVVFGAADKVIGRAQAIRGVPPEIDVNRLKKAVYDTTDPKLTPVFEEIQVPEGSGRLLAMQIFPGMPPYTDTSGRAKIRVGKDCNPLTGTLRKKLMVETGESDVTAELVDAPWQSLVSPTAMEALKAIAAKEKAPRELLTLSDEDFLSQLHLLKKGKLTKAGLLLCGKTEAILSAFPSHVWTFLRMESDTRYTDRKDGSDALPIALREIEQRIHLDNPIHTLELGLIHPEVRAYPEIALREALMNAFCHADYHLPGPILIKQYPNRLEISNPGGFIGGITEQNILHHPPVPRNPALVEVLAKLRLVNRSNLGIGRMFEAMLVEGKEPPQIIESGDSVTVHFLRQAVVPEFRKFVSEESRKGHLLGLDELLVLQYLSRHAELETVQAAALCQRAEAQMRNTLSQMERDRAYLERGGSGRGAYWVLNAKLAQRLRPGSQDEAQRRIDWEGAKTRVLSILKQRTHRNEGGITNKEIRAITHYDRHQVVRLMRELRAENPEIISKGHGKGAQYVWS
jgi:ATP-dependent DNA helicase RecG